MPIFRYFVFVGGALLALLFVADFSLPKPPAAQSIVTASSDLPLIRIRSERKLPERLVLDTSQPTIAPPTVTTAAVAAPQQPVQARVSPALSEMSAKARVRETFAQFVPEPKADATSVKKADAKPQAASPTKRKVAKTRWVPSPFFGRPMMVAQQPHFGLFNTTW
jgi:hypothetical protein